MQKLLFLLLLSPSLLWARGWCAGGDDSFTEVYWSPQVFDREDYTPFYFTFERLYDYKWSESPYKYKDNTAEWIDFLGKTPLRSDVDSLLYTQDKATFQQLLDWVKSDKQPKGMLVNNSFAKLIKAKKDIDAAEYLLFAKKCEKWVNIGTDPWAVDEPTKDTKAMMTLFAEGEQKWASVENAFLKRRYAFQCVRLAQYAGQAKKALDTYEKMLGKDNSESVIKYWAMGHKAGAMRTLGMNIEANYLFSLIFDKCPSKRVNMYYSFRPESDEEWTKIMAKCRNEREKTTLFLLRAINPASQGLEEMQNIAKIDPKSEYSTLLLVREICKLETALMGYEFKFNFPIKMDYKPEYSSEDDQITAKYLYKLRDYVVAQNEEGDTDNPQVWQLAQAYLQYLTGSFSEATTSLDKLSAQGVDAKVKQKIKEFRFLLQVSQLKSLDIATEDKLFKAYQALEVENGEYVWKKPIYDCMNQQFLRCYQNQGEIGKAFLCEFGAEGLLMQKANIAILDNLIGLIDNPKSSFEKHLFEQIPEGKDLLFDIKGTEFWRKGDLQAAKKYFEQTSAAYRGKEGYFQVHFNPFEGFIKDCHDCLADKFAESMDYNKLWILNKMLSLEDEALKNPAKAAENYQKLGNASYNISYFAPAWRSLAYYRNTYCCLRNSYDFLEPQNMRSDVSEEEKKEFSAPNFDMTKAVSYYQKAIAAKPNKEQEAQIQFMIAKCRLNTFYTEKASHQDVLSAYKVLKDKYADTKYYAEILRECKYFADYTKRK